MPNGIEKLPAPPSGQEKKPDKSPAGAPSAPEEDNKWEAPFTGLDRAKNPLRELGRQIDERLGKKVNRSKNIPTQEELPEKKQEAA